MDWNAAKGEQGENVLSSTLKEKKNAVFNWKMSGNDGNDIEKKTFSKIFYFSKTLCIFSNVSTDFTNWNVRKGQQGKMCCPVCKKINAVFQTKTPELTSKKTISKFVRFLLFSVQILLKYRWFSWICCFGQLSSRDKFNV